MAFSTTCPECKTSFKVTPDQLERGRGQVRCGVCKHVFPGTDHLRYLADPQASGTSQASLDEPATTAPPRRAGNVPPVETDAAALRPPGAPLFPAPRAGEWDPLHAMTSPAQPDGHGTLTASRDDAPPVSHPGLDPAAVFGGGTRPRRTGEAQAGADERHSEPNSIFTQTPSRWRESAVVPDDHGPARRTKSWHVYVLIALLVLAALLLMLLFRSEIAARIPALRPLAAVVAGAFGMSADGVRSISSLSIESTELQRAGNGQAALHALLRNKDERMVRWPALELTLTDPAGTVVLRKVILPADYLSPKVSRDGLRANSEWPIRLGLDPGSLPLANYSVSLFYP